METSLPTSASSIYFGLRAPRTRFFIADGPNWLWWLFLTGIVAFAFAGPACAIG